MKNLLPKFALKQYSTHVAILVIFIHNYVLDRDLKCTCAKDDKLFCDAYMALPFFILFALQLWTDTTFKAVWKYSCNGCCRCKFFLVLACQIVKAACVGLLWVCFLLIDGDWYVCCYNRNKAHPDLGCKENITAIERVLIFKLKNESMLIGLSILLTGFLVVTFVLSLGWKKCCRTSPSYCDGNHLYDQMILEEEGNILTEILRNAAKDKLAAKMKQKLDTERWRECFDAAENLIKEKTPPGKKEDIPLQDRNPESENLMKKQHGSSKTI